MSWHAKKSPMGFVRIRAGSAMLTVLFASSLCSASQNARFRDRHSLREHETAQPKSVGKDGVAGEARKIEPKAVELQADVLTDRWQPARGGLRFLLEITNGSESTVSIYDPSDVMNIQLTNEAGFPVALPSVPSLLFINTADRRETRARLDRDRPFVFDGPSERELPPGVKTIEDVDDRGFVTLDPGERFWVHARITHVIANPQEVSQHRAKFIQENPGLAPPPPPASAVDRGSYLLRVSLPLVQQGGVGVTLQSKKIPIGLE